tara:strand:+ start:791 stop:1078 length:288 start_codon:yes stop_codon:yes gene_type:complete
MCFIYIKVCTSTRDSGIFITIELINNLPETKMLILKIDQVLRNDMIKIAEASSAKMTVEMEAFINKLIEDGKYAKPTEDEFDLFDELFDAMEDAA